MSNIFERRRFLQSAAALPALGSAAAAGTLREPARELRVVEEDDVIVCGGGPAGVVAAIAAARAGAKTRLIESQGCAGGTWTSGLMTELSDAVNKRGVLPEIVEGLKKMDAWRNHSFEPEAMKVLLDRMCREAGVKVRLHTMVVGAVKDGRRVTHAITESKSGREAWAAKVFIDASGDGDLAARAGCGFDFGHPETHEFQPFSIRCVLGGITNMDSPYFTEKDRRKRVDMLHDEVGRAGITPSYRDPSLFALRDGVAGLMANHEYGYSPLDAEAVAKATIEARDEMWRFVAGLRSLGGPWKSLWMAATSEMIGMRESRRIHGLYTLTVDDARNGARFADAVGRATYPIDIHSTNPNKSKGVGNAGVKMKPFDIPLRCLIARDVDTLMMAGRCISGDHVAHGSYRISGNASATGEAAGRTAAKAARTNRLPREVKFEELGLVLPA